MRTPLLVLVGCTKGPSSTVEPPFGTSTGECVLSDDNALRATCTVSLAAPGTVDVELTDGTHTALFTDDLVAIDHVIPLWGMTPESTWTYTIRAQDLEQTGTIQTGSLPTELEMDLLVEDRGESSVRGILAPLACGSEGWGFVFDMDGRVWWYEDMQRGKEFDSLVKAMNFGDDDQVVALLGPRQIVSVDLAGNETQRFSAPDTVHHDVLRKDGITYALLAEQTVQADGKDYVQDIIGGFDAAGNVVYEFHTTDLGIEPPPGPPSSFWASEFPGATDAWHSNGIYVADSGAVYLSAKRVNSVLKIVNGAVEWSLLGTGTDNYLPADFALIAANGGDPVFTDQHHPALLPNGHLTVFDNHIPRGLELEVDEAARTATFVREWPIAGPCPFHGSVYPIEDGHFTLNCSINNEFWEFDANGSMVRRVNPECRQGSLPFQTPRGVPLDLWDAHVGTVRAQRVQ